MSDDIKLDNYRKSVQRVLDDYEKQVTSAAKEIDSTVKELENLGVKDPLKQVSSLLKDKDKNKKKLAEGIQKARQSADAAADSLRVNLAVLQVPPDVPEESLKKFLTWLEKNIKERSVKVSKNAKIKLQLFFNKKGTELQGGGLEFIWNF